MGLETRGDLQLVLDIAQEQIGRAEYLRARSRHIAARLQARQRFDSARCAQARIASAIDQRERLHDKLELADAAMAELDIAAHQLGRTQLILDLHLHRAQLANRVEIQIDAVDEAAQLRDEALTGGDRACDRTRAQQRGSLPGLAVGLVKIERARDRSDERSGGAAGTQAQIDPEAMGRKNLVELLAQALRLRVPIEVVGSIDQIDQIDVRTEI